MNEPFLFYRALDPLKGSWDGYGFFRLGENDFVAFVTDAPSAASIHTPELIKKFWEDFSRTAVHQAISSDIGKVELADGINRLQDYLQKRSRSDSTLYQATLCLAYKRGSQLLYCSIGDSVLQLFRNNKLYRLTNSEVWDGALIVEEGQKLMDRQRTKPLQFVGEDGKFVEPSHVLSCNLQPGDLLVFNTDGVEDLISPDRLIPLLKSDANSMRSDMERIFRQENLKDDITFLCVSVILPPSFESQKEILTLRSQVEKLQKEQSQFRNDLTQLALLGARLEKLENILQQLSRQVELLGKKIPATTGTRAQNAVSITAGSPRTHSVWFIVLTAFLLGLLTGLGIFYWSDRQDPVPASPIVTRPKPAAKDKVSPPKISSDDPCSYAVQKGDTLDKIAAAKKTTVNGLLQLNPALKKETPLKIGQTLAICKNPL